MILLVVAYLVVPGGAVQDELQIQQTTLTGDERMVIDNTTARLQGNLTVKDNAQLILRNGAELIVDQDYHCQFIIKLLGDASMVIEDATVETSIAGSYIEVHERASLSVRESQVDVSVLASPGGQVEIKHSYVRDVATERLEHPPSLRWGRAVISVQDSELHAFTLRIHGPSEVVLPPLGPRAGTHASISQDNYIVGWSPYDITLDNTSMSFVYVDVGKHARVTIVDSDLRAVCCYDTGHVEIVDSVVQVLVLQIEDATATFGDLSKGYHENWKLKASRGYLPCSVVLRRTSIEVGWQLRMRGGNLRVHDAQITRLRDEFDSASARYHISDSCIEEWLPWWNHGTLRLENCVLGRIHAPDGSSPTLRGSFSVAEEAICEEHGPWRNDATITRWFPVQIYDEHGSPLARVEVELTDPNGQVVHRAFTDSAGRLDPGFKVKFDEENYGQQWTVSVPSTLQERSFGLLSSTPITFPHEYYTPPTVEDCYGTSPAPSDPAAARNGTSWGSEDDGTITAEGPLTMGSSVTFRFTVKNPAYIGATGRPRTVRFAVRFRPGSTRLGNAIEGYHSDQKWIWGDSFEEVAVPVEPCADAWCGEAVVRLCEDIQDVQIIGPNVPGTISFGLEIP